MNENLDYLLDILKGNAGWPAALAAWIGSVRVVAKPFALRLKSYLEVLIANAEQAPERPDHDPLLAFIGSRTYSVIAFTVDLLLSVKLPTGAGLVVARGVVYERSRARSAGGVVEIIVVGLALASLTACSSFDKVAGANVGVGYNTTTGAVTTSIGLTFRTPSGEQSITVTRAAVREYDALGKFWTLGELKAIAIDRFENPSAINRSLNLLTERDRNLVGYIVWRLQESAAFHGSVL